MTLMKITFVFGLILLFPNATNAFTAEFEFSMNDIEFCHDVYPQYEVLGLDWFIENYHYSIEARMQKLLERSLHYIELEIQESKEEAKTGINDPTPAIIPSWIKTTTGYWVDGFTSDVDLVNGFQWLIQNGVIYVPYAESSEDESAITIPSWIKTSAGYWIDNKITDDEFLISIEWLINNGIIRV